MEILIPYGHELREQGRAARSESPFHDHHRHRTSGRAWTPDTLEGSAANSNRERMTGAVVQVVRQLSARAAVVSPRNIWILGKLTDCQKANFHTHVTRDATKIAIVSFHCLYPLRSVR